MTKIDIDFQLENENKRDNLFVPRLGTLQKRLTFDVNVGFIYVEKRLYLESRHFSLRKVALFAWIHRTYRPVCYGVSGG